MKKQMYGGIYVKPMIKHRGKFSEHPSEETWSVIPILGHFSSLWAVKQQSHQGLTVSFIENTKHVSLQ